MLIKFLDFINKGCNYVFLYVVIKTSISKKNPFSYLIRINGFN